MFSEVKESKGHILMMDGRLHWPPAAGNSGVYLRNNFGNSEELKRVLPSFAIENVFVSSFSKGSNVSGSDETMCWMVRLILRYDVNLSAFSDSAEVIA